MYLAHLEKLNRIRLADVLVDEGVVDRARLEELQAEQDRTGKQLGEVLIESEILTDYDLAKIVVSHYSLPYLDIAAYAMRREVVSLLPEEFRHRWAIQPLDQFGTILTLAVSEVPTSDLIEDIVETTNLTPILFVAPRRAVLTVIEDERKRAANRSGAKTHAKHAAPAAKAAQASPVGPAGEPAARPDAALPEFDLPTVPMKLSGGVPAGRAATGAKPATAGTGKQGAAALSWMDTVGGGKPAAHDPATSKVTKFGRPGTAPAAGRTPAAPARGAAPGGAPARGENAGGSWQTMFDAADESLKKPKPDPRPDPKQDPKS
jgi:hypothetical protein